MTAQISDSVRFQNQEWEIAALRGGELFEPSAFGIEPQGSSTACWRGFYCQYGVAWKRLTLKHLEIGVALQAEPLGVALHGHLPTKSTRYGTCGQWNYRNIALPIPFSGGIVLARGFIDELYVHMGFHPAWKYKRVCELLFENGTLLQTHDRSEAVALVRAGYGEEMSQPGALPPDGWSRREPKSLVGWIERCFSLDYEKSGLD